MHGRTPEGDALTDLVLPVFELNGEFLAAAEMITAPHELTPARWQVLGAVLEDPLPVAEIARRVGLTRQSIQRVANDVVAQAWARWTPNPARRGQSLLVLTERGKAAVGELARRQRTWADAVGAEFDVDDLRALANLVSRVAAASRRARAAGPRLTGA